MRTTRLSAMIILAAQLALKVLPMVNVVSETDDIILGGPDNEIEFDAPSRLANKCNDKEFTTVCKSEQESTLQGQAGDLLYFDLTAPKDLRTIYISTDGGYIDSPNEVEIWVATIFDFISVQAPDGTLCKKNGEFTTGLLEGYYDCQQSGNSVNAQYIIIKILTANTKIKIAEVLAWNALNISVSSVELMGSTGDVVGKTKRITNFHEFEYTDYCLDFEASSYGIRATIPNASEVSNVMIQANSSGKSGIHSVDVNVLTGTDETDASHWTQCGSTLNMQNIDDCGTTDKSYNIGYVNCGPDPLTGSKVEFNFGTNDGQFQLCKIGVFEADNATEAYEVVTACPTEPATCTTEEASSVALKNEDIYSTTYDLVAGPAGTIPKPEVDSLVSCTITWNAYLANNDSDLSLTYPTLFEMATDQNLTLKGAVNDIDERQSLYSLNGSINSFYFEGTLNDTGATKIRKSFDITFEDPCLTASVQAPTLNLNAFDWNESGVQAESSMLDTQEVLIAGTCGEKLMTLIPDSISPSTMPQSHIVENNYLIGDTSYVRIDYNPVGADSSYAGADAAIGEIYTVDYSIAITKYASVAPVTGSFTFTVVGSDCPARPAFTEDTSFSSPSYTFDLQNVDLQNQVVLTIPLPAIDVISSLSCYPLDWDVIQVVGGQSMLTSPLQATSFALSGSPQLDFLTITYTFDESSATRYSDRLALHGVREFELKGSFTNSDEVTQDYTVIVDFQDACQGHTSFTMIEDPTYAVTLEQNFDLLWEVQWISFNLPTYQTSPQDDCHIIQRTLTEHNLSPLTYITATLETDQTILKVTKDDGVKTDHATRYALNSQVLRITVTDTLVGTDPVVYTDKEFQITLVDPCVSAEILIPSDTIIVIGDTSLDFIPLKPLTDVEALQQYDYLIQGPICGDETVTFSATPPSEFIYFEPISTIIVYDESRGVVEAGDYEITIDIAMLYYPSVTLTDSFVISVIDSCPEEFLAEFQDSNSDLYEVDLLLQIKTLNITQPQLIGIPRSCYSYIEWNFHRAEDDYLMDEEYEEYGNQVEGDIITLNLASDSYNVANALTWVGNEATASYYWIGKIFFLTSENKEDAYTNRLDIQIHFTDNCRTATIHSQRIGPLVGKNDQSKTFEVPDFIDSVDTDHSYAIPYICGEKTVSFDNAPPFLTLIPSASAGLVFGIEYDHTKAPSSDQAIDYKVAYTVTFRYDDYGQYNDFELRGTFDFVVEGTLDLADEECEDLPTFQVQCDESDWVLDLRAIEQFANAEEIDVELGDTQEFISFLQNDMQFNFTESDKSPPAGQYDIKINHDEKCYEMIIKITCLVDDFIVAIEQPKVEYEYKVFKNPPVPVVEDVNDNGKVSVQFNSTMFPRAALNESEIETGTSARLLQSESIQGLSSNDYRNFSKINNGTVVIDGEIKPSLLVEVKPADPDGICANSLSFSWECIDYSESDLVLQMYFENPECISVSKDGRDKVVLTFYEQMLFSDITKRGIPPKMQIEKDIVRQSVEDGGAVTVALGTTMVVAASAAATVATSTAVFLNIGLKPLIDALKGLQLIIHMMLISAFTFETKKTFFDTLLLIANFEVLPADDLLIATFPVMDENGGINPKFEDTGYEYSDAILNMGQSFVIIIFVIPILCLLFLVSKRYCCNEKMKKFFKRQLKNTVFDRIIMFIDASIIVIATSAWVNIYQVSRGAVPASLSFYISIGLLFLLTLSYTALLVYILRNFESVLDEESKTKKRIGAFYEGYSVKRAGKFALVPIYVSLGRRMLIGLVVTYGEGNLLLQLSFVHFSSILMLAVLGLLRPLVSRSAHIIEFAGEMLILILLNHFLGMTDLLTDLNQRSIITWSCIVLITLSIILSFGMIIRTNIIAIITRIRLIKLRNENKKKLEEKQARRNTIEELRRIQLESQKKGQLYAVGANALLADRAVDSFANCGDASRSLNQSNLLVESKFTNLNQGSNGQQANPTLQKKRTIKKKKRTERQLDRKDEKPQDLDQIKMSNKVGFQDAAEKEKDAANSQSQSINHQIPAKVFSQDFSKKQMLVEDYFRMQQTTKLPSPHERLQATNWFNGASSIAPVNPPSQEKQVQLKDMAGVYSRQQQQTKSEVKVTPNMIFNLYQREKKKLDEDPSYQGGGRNPPFGPVCMPAKYARNDRARYLGMLTREWNRLYNPEYKYNLNLLVTPRALDQQ